MGLKDEANLTNYYASQESHYFVDELKNLACGQGERVIYFYSAGGEG